MNLFSLQNEEFSHRHIGPGTNDTAEMLATIGVESMEELIGRTVPSIIRMNRRLNIPEAVSEAQYLRDLAITATKNNLIKII